MKPKTISFGRTFSNDYQSYRADIQVELEEWETDLDSCFDKLREMVYDQIGLASDDFSDDDKVTIAPLRAHVRLLYDRSSELQSKISALEHRYNSLSLYKLPPLLRSVSELIDFLKSFNVPEEKYQDVLRSLDSINSLLNPESVQSEPVQSEDEDEDSSGYM